MPHTGGGRWNCRLLTAPLLPFVFSCRTREGNCWPLLASPDHSPLTPLCNSQNIPLVIIIPTKKKQTDPCFPFDFLTVVCHCWLSPSLLSFFFLRWIDMKYFPSVSSLSSVSPPPSVAALSHPPPFSNWTPLPFALSLSPSGWKKQALPLLSQNFCFRRRLQLSAVSKPLVSEAQLTFTTCQSTADLYFPPEELVEKETGH